MLEMVSMYAILLRRNLTILKVQNSAATLSPFLKPIAVWCHLPFNNMGFI